VGYRPNDSFTIWTGTGANGKTLTKILAKTAFGGYFYEPDAGMFCVRAISGGSLSSELAKLKGKRLCMVSECESKDSLRVGLLKKISGHDQIQARDLYKSAAEFDVIANTILLFNDCPTFDDSSDGIARRLKLVQYLMKFLSSPAPNTNERLIDTSLPGKFKDKAYGACFLGYLIDRFHDHGFNFTVPESVMLASKEYIGENDVVGQFLNQFYTKTGAGDDKIKLKDIWETLRHEGRSYYDQMGITATAQLSQKLKQKGIMVKVGAGNLSYVFGYKVKAGDIEDDADS
jgi:phage/plasmid-associated DNA primase